jgi:hypothetical protein
MLKGSFSFVKAVVPQHGARAAVAQRRGGAATKMVREASCGGDLEREVGKKS